MKTKKKMSVKRIQIQDVEGRLRNLNFTGFTEGQRQSWKKHAKRIVQCRRQSEPVLPIDEQWLNNRPTADRKRLVLLGVLGQSRQEREAAEQVRHSLKSLLDAFIAVKSNHRIASGTLAKWRRSASRLSRFFTTIRQRTDIRDITQDDAEAFYSWLIDSEGLSEGSTANRTASDARAIFKRALQQKLIEVNPFAAAAECGICYTVQPNKDNWHYIRNSEKLKIWNVLSDEVDQLRFLLMIRLGVRSPSELNELKWSDINWNTGMIEIRSPKLKRYPKHYRRHCPVTFPDVLPLLKAAYQKRNADNANIVKPIANSSLTKKVKGWLGRANVDIWPALLINFRRTAETDMCEIWPSHVVAAYMGHSEKIANEHYRIATDDQAKKAEKARSILDATDGAA